VLFRSGVSIAILFGWTVLNCFRVDKLGWVANLAAVVQCSSVVIIIAIILARAPTFQSAEFVFTNYFNASGFVDKSYVGAISLIAALFSFSGYEASAHMAEETHGSKTSAPMGIVYTCFATGLTGLAFLLGMLFVSDNIAAITASDDYFAGTNSTYVLSGNEAVEVFRRAAGESYGSGLAWVLVVTTFFAGMSSVTITGRITFALARDKVFPFSEWMATVHPTLKSPVNVLFVIWFLDSCLICLQLGSEVAFLSITGITVIGFQVSYGIPILLKLIFHNEYFKDQVKFPPTSPEVDLGLFWSRVLGVISSVWLFGTSCIFFLPQEGPFSAIDEQNMNWSIVIVSGFVFLGIVNWILNARFFYEGPKRLMDMETYTQLRTTSGNVNAVPLDTAAVIIPGGGI